jgi:hypothetical protein
MKTQIDPTDDVPDAIPFPLPLDTEQESREYYRIWSEVNQPVTEEKSPNTVMCNDTGSAEV